ncbi:hypothetical protein [Janibacter alittae]|uniref:DUF402 domain-containing protein n=1 Tax=Janibacter alittae TaxID=3115209 RepID=A0ABZ2MDY0_9MICO
MGWLKVLKNKAVAVPSDVELQSGERVLATAATDDGTLVITSRRLIAPGAGAAGGKPWHLVDSGRWEPEGSVLVVSWVDGSTGGQWHLTDPGGVPDAFHERVNASVLLVEHVRLDRSRRARVVLRKDLTTDAVLAQTIVARGCDPDDAELVAVTEQVAARLAEQVGQEP